MPITSYSGRGSLVPGWFGNNSSAPSIAVLGTIDATGEKLAFVGRFWHPSGSTKNIRRVQFRFSTIVKAGGSGLTVSLQNVNAAAGPPGQPDETQDQTVAIANGDAGFASSQWYRTNTLSADRSVAIGEELAVVLEYDGSGRLGSDSVTLTAISITSTGLPLTLGSTFGVLKTAGWTLVQTTSHPIMLLECDDGTFGILDGCVAVSAVGSTNLQSDTTPDEIAIKLSPTFDARIDALYCFVLANNTGSNYNLILYDSGGTALETISQNPFQIASLVNAHTALCPIAPRILTAGGTYYVAVKPTQDTQNVTVYHIDVNDAAHWAVNNMVIPGTYVQRTDAGSWSETTTRMPMMGVRLAGFQTAANGCANFVW